MPSLPHEPAPEFLLDTAQMGLADAYAIRAGIAGEKLMEAAGRAITDAICERFEPTSTAVFCGPGNNGGDGYVVARMLHERGWNVWVETLGDPARLSGDAAIACAKWTGGVLPISPDNPMANLKVDALFGAGLTRALSGEAERLAALSAEEPEAWIAVDVPSGIDGSTGQTIGPAFRAALTVTFFRRKPAHLLYPARAHMGEVVVADIGIPPDCLGEIAPRTAVNAPGLWDIPSPQARGHKYSRGHAVVVSGDLPRPARRAWPPMAL